MRHFLYPLLFIFVGLLIACQSRESGPENTSSAAAEPATEPLAEGGRFVTPADHPHEQVSPTARRHVISGEEAMVVIITMDPPAAENTDREVQLHSHPAEQITYALKGSFTMTLGGVTKTLQPGDMCIMPANVLHGGRPGPDGCTLMDVFSPVREEFLAQAITVDN